jgi:hypothetical protein
MVVAVFVNAFNTKDANTAAIDILRERYGDTLRQRLPSGSVLDWDARGPGHRSLVLTELPGAGYVSGDNDAAAEWSLTVATTWLDVLEGDPIGNLEQLVRARVPGAQLGPSDDEDAGDE